MTTLRISGLTCPATVADLEMSTNAYNNLKGDHEQPYPSQRQLDDLGRLFSRHDALGAFGLHLLHSHVHLPAGHVMLGSKFNDNRIAWVTHQAKYDAAQNIPLHGHIYTLVPNQGLLPYEFREGPAPTSAVNVSHTFFEEFADYLASHGLASLLGLQVLENASPMLEFVVEGCGTIMIREEVAAFNKVYRTTGWIFQEIDGIVSAKGQEAHAVPPNGQHQIYRDQKSLKSLASVERLLVHEGVLAETTVA